MVAKCIVYLHIQVGLKLPGFLVKHNSDLAYWNHTSVCVFASHLLDNC